MEPKQKVFIIIGSIAVLAAAAIGGAVLLQGSGNNQPSQAMSSTTSTAVTPSAATTSNAAPATTATTPSAYKDGTYTSAFSYMVPHGVRNSINVSLTVSGGIITDVKTDNSYSDRESSMYVGGFESAVSSDAKNQLLADYNPSRIGGASLTTEAFAGAVNAIRSQATS